MALVATAALLGACDSGLLEPQILADAPVVEQPRRQKLATVRLELDAATGTMRATVFPVLPVQLSVAAATGGSATGARRVVLVNDLLQASNVSCLGCGNGILGAHQITVTLTNVSTFNLSNIGLVSMCSNCTLLAVTPAPPAVLAPGGSYTPNFAVNVTASPFALWVDVYADVTAP